MRSMCMCMRVNVYPQKCMCISACAYDSLSLHWKLSFSILHSIHWGKVFQLSSERPLMTTSQASQKLSDPLSHLLECYKCKWATTPQAGFCMSHWGLNSDLRIVWHMFISLRHFSCHNLTFFLMCFQILGDWGLTIYFWVPRAHYFGEK